jgi:anthranilate phosphoribosyltransferase
VSATPVPPLRQAIRQLAMGGSLSEPQAREAFGIVMRGEATPAQIAALLVALRVKGETAEEVAGAADALRGAMVRLPAERPDLLVDTCGTGGGSVGTFNISTAAALLAAGLGVRIAKHGNRSFTSQCGSADVLEALGVPIDVSVEVMERALRDAGIVFMFAPLMHPAMRHVGPVRSELAIPTVMNIVGPLANPASAGRQVVGVADEARVPLIAGALRALGAVHALVVHGAPGMDEVSPLGPTRVVEIRDGTTREWSVEPRSFGFGEGRAEELAGGPPAQNAAAVLAVLHNEAPPTATAAVVLNAAAALYVSGSGPTEFGDAVATARAGLIDGAGMRALERLRTAYGGNQVPLK